MAEKSLFSKEWESLIYNECEKRGYFGVNGNLHLQDFVLDSKHSHKNIDSKNTESRKLQNLDSKGRENLKEDSIESNLQDSKDSLKNTESKNADFKQNIESKTQNSKKSSNTESKSQDFKHSHKNMDSKNTESTKSQNLDSKHSHKTKKNKKTFCIMMPPPNVTGVLHIGHALTFTLQDIIVRYKRMQGYKTLWQPGLDHAGIATQNVVEKQLLSQGITKEELGREKFIQKVWQWKEESGGKILEQMRLLGFSPDFSRTRFTMDAGLANAVRHTFVDWYNRGLIYRGARMINWCTHDGALSDIEVEYKENAGKLYYLRYEIVDFAETKSQDSKNSQNLDSKKTSSLDSKESRHDLFSRSESEVSNAESANAQNKDASTFATLKSQHDELNLQNLESRFYKTNEIHNLDSKKVTESKLQGNSPNSKNENMESKTQDFIESNSLRSVAEQHNSSVRSTQPLESRLSRGVKNRNQGDSSVAADFSQATEKRGTPPLSKKSGCFFTQRGSGEGDLRFFAQETHEIPNSDILESSDHKNLDSIQTASLDSKENARFIESANAQNKDASTFATQKSKHDELNSQNLESRFYKNNEFDNLESKKVTDSKNSQNLDSKKYIIVATTRPETFFGDTAVMVNPKDSRFHNFIGKKVRLPIINKEIPIISDTHVDMEFGSGAVKVTPAHDINDYEVGLRHNLEQVVIFDKKGVLNACCGEFAGFERLSARELIVAKLQELGAIEKIEPHANKIGTCYRCGNVIEPYISQQWFVKADIARGAIARVARGEARFFPPQWINNYNAWMRDLRDWCISRQLWWGHRIPVFYCACGAEFASESLKPSCPNCGSVYEDSNDLDSKKSQNLRFKSQDFSTQSYTEKVESNEFYNLDSKKVREFKMIDSIQKENEMLESSDKRNLDSKNKVNLDSKENIESQNLQFTESSNLQNLDSIKNTESKNKDSMYQASLDSKENARFIESKLQGNSPKNFACNHIPHPPTLVENTSETFGRISHIQTKDSKNLLNTESIFYKTNEINNLDSKNSNLKVDFIESKSQDSKNSQNLDSIKNTESKNKDSMNQASLDSKESRHDLFLRSESEVSKNTESANDKKDASTFATLKSQHDELNLQNLESRFYKTNEFYNLETKKVRESSNLQNLDSIKNKDSMNQASLDSKESRHTELQRKQSEVSNTESANDKKDASTFATLKSQHDELNLQFTESRFYKSNEIHNLDSKKVRDSVKYKNANLKADFIESKSQDSRSLQNLDSIKNKDSKNKASLDSKENLESKTQDFIESNSLRSVAKQHKSREAQPCESRPLRSVEKRIKFRSSAKFRFSTKKRIKWGTPLLRQKSGCFFSQKGSGEGILRFFAQETHEIPNNDILESNDHENLDSIQKASLDSKENARFIESANTQNKDVSPNATLKSQHDELNLFTESKSVDSKQNLESRFYKTKEINNLDSKNKSVMLSEAKHLNKNKENMESTIDNKDASTFATLKSQHDELNLQNLDSIKITESKTIDSMQKENEMLESSDKRNLDSKENIESRFYKTNKIDNLDSKKVIESRNLQNLDSKNANEKADSKENKKNTESTHDKKDSKKSQNLDSKESKKATASKPKKKKNKITQDPDVLDTWFSSALWSHSTLGFANGEFGKGTLWQESDLSEFHPNSLLITGFDILFFWVARMLMAADSNLNQIAFKDIYLHALVLDSKGQKMSKSKGNVIDPLSLCRQYSADIVRFSLAYLCAQGRDVRMSEKQLEVTRNFTNKLANAMKFLQLYASQQDANYAFKERAALSEYETPLGIYMKSRLNCAISEACEALDAYRFDAFASVVYRFLWSEFCDIGVEYAKADKRSVFELASVLIEAMKLLHPLMPFISEFIFHSLLGRDIERGLGEFKSVMVEAFPHDSARDLGIEETFSILSDCITSIRRMRVNLELGSKELEQVYIVPLGDISQVETLHNNVSLQELGLKFIGKLAKVKRVFVRDSKPASCISDIGAFAQIFIESKNVDIAGLLSRLEAQEAKLLKEKAKLDSMLNNEKFIQNAPSSVVESNRATLNELRVKLEKISEQRANLRG